jgi:hypothetical protein
MKVELIILYIKENLVGLSDEEKIKDRDEDYTFSTRL